MARIKAVDDSKTYWYSERAATYVWSEDVNQATEMPHQYATKKIEELRRVERWRNSAERREIHICRSKLQ